MKRIFLAIALAAILAGCGQIVGAISGSAPIADSIVHAKAALPAATPLASGLGAQPAGQVLLTCYKSGGIAGTSDTWTVYTDGRVTFKGRGAATQLIQLEDAELNALRQLVEGPEFAALGASYISRGADLFAYELEVPAASGAPKTVELTLPSNHPAVLDQVIRALEAMRK